MKSLAGKLAILTAVSLLSLVAPCPGEDVTYFEKVYGVKLKGIKPIEEYQDPDDFYRAIARQLGIPKLAFDAVAKKLGWKKEKNKMLQAMVGRNERNGRWEVMVVQITIDKETKTPLVDSMQMKMVEIDDDGRTRFLEKEDKAKGEKK